MALAEAVHRARNDLQAVTAMLQLQAAMSPDQTVQAALLEALTRVRALASLNARLDAKAKGVTTVIDGQALVDGVAGDLRSMHFGQRPITLDVTAEPHRIPVDHARPLGLILNELVVNALKYAFPDDRAGTVFIDFQSRGHERILVVRDDGVGGDTTAAPRGTGLGRRMVQALAAQIGGTFTAKPGEDGVGTECVVRWPRTRPSDSG